MMDLGFPASANIPCAVLLCDGSDSLCVNYALSFTHRSGTRSPRPDLGRINLARSHFFGLATPLCRRGYFGLWLQRGSCQTRLLHFCPQLHRQFSESEEFGRHRLLIVPKHSHKIKKPVRCRLILGLGPLALDDHDDELIAFVDVQASCYSYDSISSCDKRRSVS